MTAPSEDTTVALRPLDPRARTMWMASAALGWVPVILAAVIASLIVRPWGFVAMAVALLAGVGAVFVVPPIRYRRWRYALRDEELEIRRGVVWTSVTLIPYARLQFVDTQQGPLDRAFGLATLVVHTAAPGTSGSLPGLAVETANGLRERLSSADWLGDDPSV